MLRFMNFLTLAIVAICLLIGAGIALADDTAIRGESTVTGAGAINDASRPVVDKFEENLAAADEEDIYEFDDYDADVKRPAPAVEPTDIREC
jgi:hypothetical protein